MEQTYTYKRVILSLNLYCHTKLFSLALFISLINIFLPARGLACPSPTTTFPIFEDFETNAFVNWTHDDSDDFDWRTHTGSTTSSSTGPNGAYNGTYYIYTEATSPNNNGKISNLISPCFSVQPGYATSLTFAYHMYGVGMGSFGVDISIDDGLTWTNLWSLSGDQGNTWFNQSISLDDYEGDDVKLRFNVITGTFRSDVSIDDVEITSVPGCAISNPSPGFPIDFLNNNTGWIDYDLGGNSSIEDNGDGTMTISSTIVNGTPVDLGGGISGASCGDNDGWELVLNLSDRMSWLEFQATGGGSNLNGSCTGSEYLIDFWDVTGTLTGLGCNAGRTIDITGPTAPYRFQIGDGGNSGDNTCAFGMSTWFDLNEGGTDYNADIYAFMDVSCYDEIVSNKEICDDGIDNDGDNYIDDFDPDCSCISAGLPNLDFNFDPNGQAISAGAFAAELWADWGIHISTSNVPLDSPPMILDSSNPPSVDLDLGTPNNTFGGLGVGSGGESGALGENNTDLGNVLIISSSNSLNDYFAGGTISFDFDVDVDIASLEIVDFDFGKTDGSIKIYDENNILIKELIIYAFGDNSYQKINLSVSNARKLEVTAPNSFSIASLNFCDDDLPTASIGDFVWADENGDGLQVGELGVENIEVELLNENRNHLSTTFTNSAGFYSFDNLPAGEYEVEIIVPTGFIITSDLDGDVDSYSGQFTLGDGEMKDDVDFGIKDLEFNAEKHWLEAGCAEVGSNWDILTHVTASNGSYVTIQSGNNSYNSAPTGVDDHIRFNFTISDAGDYNIFARVQAPSGEDDSFWVRVNEGTWYKWNSLNQFASSSWEWGQVYDSDNGNALLTFSLLAGANTVDFAYREDGALLDKIMVGSTPLAPTGIGELDDTCLEICDNGIDDDGDTYIDDADPDCDTYSLDCGSQCESGNELTNGSFDNNKDGWSTDGVVEYAANGPYGGYVFLNGGDDPGPFIIYQDYAIGANKEFLFEALASRHVASNNAKIYLEYYNGNTFLSKTPDFNVEAIFNDSFEPITPVLDVTPDNTTKIRVVGWCAGTALKVDEFSITICEDCPQFNDEVCYFISDGNQSATEIPDTFYTFNYITSEVVVVGPTGTGQIEAMAMDTVINRIYTVDGDKFGFININTGSFIQISSDIGPALNGAEGVLNIDDIDGMTYDHTNNIVWATERRSNTADGFPDDLLLKIDPATGLAITDAFGVGMDYLVINTPEHDLDDIAIADDGTLYAISNFGGSGNQAFGTINKLTGAWTEMGDYGIKDVESLAFTASGQLIATTGKDGGANSNKLYTIDAGTGIATFIGSISPGVDVEACDCMSGKLKNLQIGDKVFADLDADGIQGLEEPGVEGVVVNLLTSSGSDYLNSLGTPTTTVTDALGIYNFDRLPEGQFIVEFVLPGGGASFSTQNAGSDDALDSDVNTSTGRSHIISLTGSINDMTVDAGLVNANVVVRDCDDFGELFLADDNGVIKRYNPTNGALIGEFILGLDGPRDMVIGPDEWLYVTNKDTDELRKYSLFTGVLTETISEGLNDPQGMTVGPDGNVYINNDDDNAVVKLDVATGNISVFVGNGSGGLNGSKSGIEFGPDGNLYVTSFNTDEVLRFNGTTGAFIDVFVAANTSYINAPSDLTFGPDGHLYVTGEYNDKVIKYDGSTGAFISTFVNFQSGGLENPAHLKFGPDGFLYVSSQNNSIGVLKYNGTTGEIVGNFAYTASPEGILFAPVPGCPSPCYNDISISNVSVSSCIDQPLRDVATVSLDISWTNAPFGEQIHVTIGNKTEKIDIPGGATSPYNITFNVIADGSTNNTINATWETTVGCEDSAIFNSPLPCSTTEIGCDILYLCGLDKPYDGDAWDHGWIEYLDDVNGSNTVTPILTKNEAGLGTYDVMNQSTFVDVDLLDYEIIIISGTTEGHISSDLVNKLKDAPNSILLGNYDIIDEFGLSSEAGSVVWGESAYTNPSTSEVIYNYDNQGAWSGYLFTKGNYTNEAVASLWGSTTGKDSTTDGIIFKNKASDPLAGISSSHGNRIYVGYHFNGIYANNENNGIIPSPASSWFTPELHLTLKGKELFDKALIYAATDCIDEICDDGIDNDEDGLADCLDPECTLIDLNPGIISGDVISCETLTSDEILSYEDPTYSNGSFIIRWQQSSDNLNWNDIPGASGLTYSPGNITNTTYYRRVSLVSFCSVESYSNVIKKEIDNSFPICLDGEEFAFPCEGGYRVSPVGAGIQGDANPAIRMLNSSTFAYYIVEATFSGGANATDQVIFSTREGDQQIVTKKYFEGESGQSGNRYFRAILPPSDSIFLSYNGDVNLAESLVAYTVKSVDDFESFGKSVHKELLPGDNYKVSFPLTTSINHKAVYPNISISGIEDNGTELYVSVYGDGASRTDTITAPNYGNTLTIQYSNLEEILPDADSIHIVIQSPSINGQTALISGYVAALVECDNKLVITAETNGECVRVGDTLSYNYVLYNFANVGFDNLSATSSLGGDIDLGGTTISANSQINASQDIIITQTMVDNPPLVNDVFVAGWNFTEFGIKPKSDGIIDSLVICEICEDGFDNDGDGLTDCLDPDCSQGENNLFISNAGPDVITCPSDPVTLGDGIDIPLTNYGFLLKATNETTSSNRINFEKNGTGAPRLLIHTYESASPIILTAAQVARIESNNTDHNHDDPAVGYDGSEFDRSLLQFDLSSIVGTISSAELVLESTTNNNLDVSVHPIEQAWVESNASWDERDNGVLWNNPGVYSTDDYLLNTQTITSTGDFAWDVTTAVIKWLNQYEWSTGETTDRITVSPSTTTTYTLTVTPPNTCPYIDDVTVTIDDRPIVSISGLDTICVATTTNLLPNTGGTWESSDNAIAIVSNSGIVVGISEGTVAFTFTSSTTGCKSLATAEVTVVPEVDVVIDFNGSLCLNEDSKLSAVSNGGSGDYTYSWAGPSGFTATGKTIDINVDGNYDVTATDSKGCTASTTAFVYEAYEPFIFSLNSEVCEGEDVTLSVNGGSGTTYQWGANASNATSSSVTVIPSVPSSSYVVTVTNSIGCTTTATAVIDVIPRPEVDVTGDDQICIGNTTQLSPSSGGEWTSSDYSVANVDDSGLVTAIGAGSATFTFKDGATECYSDPTTQVIVDPNSLVSISGDDQICLSQSVNLTAVPAGGTWASSNDAVATIHTSTGTISPVAQGTVLITYTPPASAGCYAVTSYSINIYNDPVLSLNGPSTICEGSITFINASTSGTWTSSDESVAIVSNSGEVTGVGEGIATFSFTSSVGCTEVLGTPIRVDANPTVSITGSNSICIGETTTLSPTSGGVWISSNNSVASVAIDGTVTGKSAGNVYFTFIESVNGCVSEDNLIVTINPIPTITSPSKTSLCIGESVSISPNNGGTWTSSDNSIATITNSGTIQAISAGSATFTFTSNLTGCKSATSNPVNVQSAPTTLFTGPTEICEGETTNISPNSAGVWSSTNVSVATITNQGLITGVAPGTVRFIFTSNNTGCQSDSSEVLTIIQPAIVDVTGPTEICIGENTTLSPSTGGIWTSSNNNVATVTNNGIVTAIASGSATFTFTNNTGCSSEETEGITIISTPNVEYLGSSAICIGETTLLSPSSGGVWSSSDNAIATVANNGLVTALTQGTVTLTFTSTTTGCSSNMNAQLIVNSPPVISIVGDNNICIGENTNLQPTTGGAWISSNNSIANITSSGTVTAISAGQVTFRFIQSATGCSSEDSSPIIVEARPTVSIDGSNTICVGTTTDLLPNSGGTWTSNDESIATVSEFGVVTGISQGLARFTFVSDGGCTSNETAPVIVFDNPSVLIDGPNSICVGATVQMQPSTGGTWESTNTGVASIDDSGLVTSLAQGTTTFRYTDSNTGCISDPSDILTVEGGPVTSLNGPSEICIGGVSNMTPSTGGIWTSLDPSVATIQNNGEILGVSQGTARFLFMNLSSGCISDTTSAITVIEGTAISFDGPTDLCQGDTTYILPSSGGTWESMDPSVATISNSGMIISVGLGNTRFQYTETSSNCKSDLSELLIVNGAPTVNVVGPSTICISAQTNLSPSTGGSWESSDPSIASVDDNGIVIGHSDGTAYFTFTDSFTGCKSDGTLSVDVQTAPDIVIVGSDKICLGYTTNLSPSSFGLWTSSNPNIATATSTGVVTGHAPGVVTFQFTDPITGCSSNGSSAPITILNCTSEDFNVTLKNEFVYGDLRTNDNVSNDAIYGGNVETLSKPLNSFATLIVNTDGTYSFTGNKAGKYNYKVPVCLPPEIAGCDGTILEINVVENVFGQSNPIANLEYTTTYTGALDADPGDMVLIDATANDTCIYSVGCSIDESTLGLIGMPQNGTAVINGDYKIEYTPNPGFIGKDTIDYSVCLSDGITCSQSQQIIIVNHLSAQNSTVANDDFYYTMRGTSVTGNILNNDFDPEGESISTSAVGTELNPVVISSGTYFIASDGEFTFTPNDDFTGTLNITYTSCDDQTIPNCTGATIHLMVLNDINLNIRVYLEGALMLNSGAKTGSGVPLMRDDLRVSPFTGENYIPISDPYSFANDPFMNTESKYAHVGPGLLTKNRFIADSTAVFSVEGENAIVDWVHVEIRSKSDNTQIIGTRSGLVQRDGDIVDLDGISNLRFQGVNSDSFYVVVKHRSHLAVMSQLVTSEDVIDFTDINYPVFDFGTSHSSGLDYTGLARKNSVVSGYSALWAGDFDSNGLIKFSNPNDDQNVLFLGVLFSSPDFFINYNNAYGYFTSDFDMNSKAKYTNPEDDLNYLFSQILLYPLNSSFLSNFSSLIEQVPE